MNAVACYFEAASGHPAAIDSLRLPYAWLEAPLAARLVWVKDAPDWKNVEHWPEGRLFGEHAEYRWQVNSEGKLHGVLLTEMPLPDGLSTSALVKLDAVDHGDSNLLLWGDWIDPGKDLASNPAGDMRFYASEIPSVLDYPLDKQAVNRLAPCFKVRRYKNSQLGDFVRCVGIELQTLRKET